MEEIKNNQDHFRLASSSLDSDSNLQLDINHFSEKQIKYLELLAKFSPKQKRVKLLAQKDVSKREETYIKENLSYLEVDEQVAYNDAQAEIGEALKTSFFVGGLASLGVFGYYIIRTPVTRGLFKEGAKSLAVGLLTTYGYYRYSYEKYSEAMHDHYRRIIQKKQDRRKIRRFVGDTSF